MLGKEKRQEIVEALLEGRLIVKYGFDKVDIEQGIDWTYLHQHNQKTYSVYLHALEYMGYLVLAGEHFDDDKYFEVALNIIRSCIKYYKKLH